MNGGSHLKAAIFCYIFIQDLVNSEKRPYICNNRTPKPFYNAQIGGRFIHPFINIQLWRDL